MVNREFKVNICCQDLINDIASSTDNIHNKTKRMEKIGYGLWEEN
jgi:hypothetical protein